MPKNTDDIVKENEAIDKDGGKNLITTQILGFIKQSYNNNRK